VVLYELVAGCAPFEKSTPSEVIALILEREPPTLARYAREVPPELERIVAKALTKDREERYQTAKDLLVDLRRLRQRLEIEAEVERSAPQWLSEGVGVATNRRQETVATTGATASIQAETVRLTSSAEYLVSEIKRHKQGAVVALAISLLVLGGVGLWLYKFVTHSPPKPAPFQAIKITKLITTGNASLPSISPDGKYVAYVVSTAGRESLWISQVATSSSGVSIIPPAEVRFGRPNFSHDSNYVYYVVTDKGDPHGALYRIPALGNATPRKLLVNIQSVISLSPDDKRLAFYRSDPGAGEEVLIVTNADGTGGEQELTSRKGYAAFEWGEGAVQGPAWSPDGRVIACGVRKDSGNQPATVIVVQVEDGAQKEFTSQRWPGIGTLAWLGDGSGLMVSAGGQIFHLRYPGGEVRQITNDFRGYGGLSLTADSSTMVATQRDQLANIWVAPSGDASRARQITYSNESEGASGLSWTPDGKILCASNPSGNFDIWVMNVDGSDKKQLTFEPDDDVSPAMTPDGRYIVFASNRAGKWSNIWRMDPDGGHPKQLTNGTEDKRPHCSPDSTWVVYSNADSTNTTVWKVSIDGGNPVQLTNKDSEAPVVSPDGKWIACRYWNEQPDAPQRIAVIPFEGGEPIKLFDGPQTGPSGQRIRWRPDGRAITYVETRGGVANIWTQSIDSGPARQLTDFKDQVIFAHDWSQDGKQLAVARGDLVSTIVLIKDSR
jgi:TolB protein